MDKNAWWAVTKEELQVGKRSQGGRKRGYKDILNLKASLKDFNKSPESWEQTALDRAKWRRLIGEQMAMKQRESAKQKESTKIAKPEPRDHHQSRHSPNRLAQFATDNSEQQLA